MVKKDNLYNTFNVYAKRKDMRSMIILFGLLLITNGLSKETNQIITITDNEVYDYWESDMVAKNKVKCKLSIVEIINRYVDEVWFEYNYLIGVNGIPKDFTFIGAKPENAKVEKDLVRKYALCKRYKRDKSNIYKGATYVKSNLRWWLGNGK